MEKELATLTKLREILKETNPELNKLLHAISSNGYVSIRILNASEGARVVMFEGAAGVSINPPSMYPAIASALAEAGLRATNVGPQSDDVILELLEKYEWQPVWVHTPCEAMEDGVFTLITEGPEHDKIFIAQISDEETGQLVRIRLHPDLITLITEHEGNEPALEIHVK